MERKKTVPPSIRIRLEGGTEIQFLHCCLGLNDDQKFLFHNILGVFSHNIYFENKFERYTVN